MSLPDVATWSHVSPGAVPFAAGAYPTAAVSIGSNPSQMPIAGMALTALGVPVSFSAWVTMVKMRLPRTGIVNQSLWPT
jgi:hypothetical protein